MNSGTMIGATAILKLFPEVNWDRWNGDGETHVSVFGWLAREDGKFDFVLLMFDADGPWYFTTSSARYSAEFSGRLGWGGHSDCKRVEHFFPGVRAVHQNAQERKAAA